LVESIRPSWWKPDAETARSIEEKLSKNSKLRQQVERARSFATTPSAPPPEAPQKPEAPTSFVAIALPAGRTAEDPNSPYALRDSFLLDSGATTHVCNNRNRFTAFRQCSEREYLLAGTEKVLIEGVGRVELTVEGPDGFFTISLEDVAFVPSFHASVASLKRFMAKGVHWRTDEGALTFRGKTFCKLRSHLGQSLLEYTPLCPTSQLVPYVSALLPAAADDTEPLIGPFTTPNLVQNPQNPTTPAGQAQTPQSPPNNTTDHAATPDASPALGTQAGSKSDALNRSKALQGDEKIANPLPGAVPTGVESAPRHNEVSSNLDERNNLNTRRRSARSKTKPPAPTAFAALSWRTPDQSPTRTSHQTPPPQQKSEWMAGSPSYQLRLRTSTPELRDSSTPSSPHLHEGVASGSCPTLGVVCQREFYQRPPTF
jgi:hypothetical protein